MKVLRGVQRACSIILAVLSWTFWVGGDLMEATWCVGWAVLSHLWSVEGD